MSAERAAPAETQREIPPSAPAARADPVAGGSGFTGGLAPDARTALALQRTIGNRAVGRILRSRGRGDAAARATLARAPTATRPVIPPDPTALEVRITKDATEYYVSEFHHVTEDGRDYEVEVFWAKFKLEGDRWNVSVRTVRTTDEGAEVRSPRLKYSAVVNEALGWFASQGTPVTHWDTIWSYMGPDDISTNLRTFQERTAEGKTPEEAARLTPTGRVATSLGFTDLTVLPPTIESDLEIDPMQELVPEAERTKFPKQRAVFSKPGGQGGTGSAPPAGSGGGPGQASEPAPVDAPGPQLRASTGTPDMEPMAASELSARGLARADAHGLLLDLTNATLNRINDEIQRRRAEEQLRALQPEVERVQRERPDCGVLLVPILRQLEADGFSAIVPGPALVRTEMGIGRDLREATLDRVVELKSAPGSAEREFEGEAVWIPAPRPVDPPPPPPPFPTVALATFASGTPTLTNVAFAFLPAGFDDVGETKLEIPPGLAPRFHVLALPQQITAWDRNPRGPEEHVIEIAQETHGGLPAALLDVYVPFDHDVAVAIFPADAATAKLFNTAPAMGNWAALVPHRESYTLVRWVSPDQIRLLDR